MFAFQISNCRNRYGSDILQSAFTNSKKYGGNDGLAKASISLPGLSTKVQHQHATSSQEPSR